MVNVAGTAIDYQNAANLYEWALSSLLIVFFIGLTVGAIIRIIRSV